MSSTWNDTIRENAREMAEECTNSSLGAQLDRAIQADDLDLMRLLTHEAQQHLTYIETVNNSEIY